MIGWRATVSEAAKDLERLWRLVKLAKKGSEEQSRSPQMPDIRDKEGKIYTKDTEKVETMARHFFPQPVQADLTDIEGTTYPVELDDISSIITESEIQGAMGKLANEKAPGPDAIPNWILINCRLTLSKDLGKLFNVCISRGYHPKGFKDSVTIVLRKPQKETYDNLKL